MQFEGLPPIRMNEDVLYCTNKARFDPSVLAVVVSEGQQTRLKERDAKALCFELEISDFVLALAAAASVRFRAYLDGLHS